MEFSWHCGLVFFLSGVFTDVTWIDLNQCTTLLSETPPVHRRRRGERNPQSSQLTLCHAIALQHSQTVTQLLTSTAVSVRPSLLHSWS
jgi:hypothetical protein